MTSLLSEPHCCTDCYHGTQIITATIGIETDTCNVYACIHMCEFLFWWIPVWVCSCCILCISYQYIIRNTSPNPPKLKKLKKLKNKILMNLSYDIAPDSLVLMVCTDCSVIGWLSLQMYVFGGMTLEEGLEDLWILTPECESPVEHPQDWVSSCLPSPPLVAVPSCVRCICYMWSCCACSVVLIWWLLGDLITMETIVWW